MSFQHGDNSTNQIATAYTNYGEMNYLINDYYIAMSFDNNYMYEQDIVESTLLKYIQNASVIIDVGAHIGSHTVMYGVLNPTAKIYSFEIQSTIYKLLQRNVIRNRLHNVELYHCAVGNKTKMVTVNNEITDGPNANEPYEYASEKYYNFGGVSLGSGGEQVMMTTIDNLNLDRCDFIKIDVEGFEYPVILGAINTIIKYKPVIFYEKNSEKPFNRELANIAEIDEFDSVNVDYLLLSLGYRNFINVGKINMLAYP